MWVPSQPARAAEAGAAGDGAEAARATLLSAVAKGGDVEGAIERLLPYDPSKGRAAVSPGLDGEWRLLWSAKAEAFSPLLQLPPPLRPDSYQLLGPAATRTVGKGRVAQVRTKTTRKCTF